MTLETDGEFGWVSSVFSIAIGDDGNPIIAHRDGYYLNLELFVCTVADCSTGANVTLETTGDVGLRPSIAIGVDGNPVIAHQDATNNDLELYVCTASDCSTGSNLTLETTGAVGQYPSIAIGHDGNPIIAHRDGTNSVLKLAKVFMPASGVVYR